MGRQSRARPSSRTVEATSCRPDTPGTPAPSLIIVGGELDIFGASKVHDAVHEHVRSASHVVLDLSSVTMIDSGGIVFLESIGQALASRRDLLTIHDPSRIVERVKKISGTNRWIPVCRPVGTGCSRSDDLRGS